MAKIKKTTKKFLKQKQKMGPKKKKKLNLSKQIKRRTGVKESKEKAKEYENEESRPKVSEAKDETDDLLDCDFFGESDDDAADNDEEDDDDAESVYDAKEHASELAALKESDPSFYKFLEDNDTELLNFEASDEENETEEKTDKTVLTAERFQQLKEHAEKKSFRAFRVLLAAFRSAVKLAAGRKSTEEARAHVDRDNKASMDKQRREKRAKVDEEMKEIQAKVFITISDDDIMRGVISWMCANASSLLEHHLGNRKGKHAMELSSYKNGKKCARIGRAFWCEALFLMKKGHVDLQELVLETCGGEKMMRFLWPYPKLRNLVQKEISFLWSHSHRHHVRLLAFLFLRNAVSFPSHVSHSSDPEDTVRTACKMFAHATEKKFTWRSIDSFRFLENGLVELLKTDEKMAYRIGYAYIRQLAFILRNASHTATIKQERKKEKKIAPLHSWSFIRSCSCWTHIVCSMPNLRPLAYPLMMVLTGAIKSQILSLQYFPYVYHCIRCLNTLGSRLDCYVPISSYALRLLSNVAAKLEKSDKTEGKMSRVADVEVQLHFSEVQCANKQTLEHMAYMTHQLLIDHLGFLSRTPAFPELIQPVLSHLRKLTKNLHSETLRRDIKSFIASAESSVTFARSARETLSLHADKFAVFDKVPLADLRTQWMDRRARELTQRIAAEQNSEAKENNEETNAETAPLSKRQKKRLRQKEKQVGVVEEKLNEEEEGRRKTTEDVVESMEFSDDEEGLPKGRRGKTEQEPAGNIDVRRKKLGKGDESEKRRKKKKKTGKENSDQVKKEKTCKGINGDRKHPESNPVRKKRKKKT